MSSDNALGDHVGHEHSEWLSASADGGTSNDELFKQYMDLPNDYLESFEPQISQSAHQDTSLSTDNVTQLSNAEHQGSPPSNENDNNLPVASFDQGKDLTGSSASASDFPHLLPYEYGSIPLLGTDTDTTTFPIQWDSFEGVQDSLAELFTPNHPEDQDANPVRTVEPTSEPTTTEHDGVEMDYPYTMTGIMPTPIFIQDDSFSRRQLTAALGSQAQYLASQSELQWRPVDRRFSDSRPERTIKKPKKSRKAGKVPGNIPASHFHTLDLNLVTSETVSAAEKKKTMEVRRIRACHRCRILHKTCGPETPCMPCQGLSTSIYRLGCVRTKTSDLNFFELVNTLFVHNRSLRRKHGFTIMQAERHSDTQMMLSHAKILMQSETWSLFDGPNDNFPNAIEDIVFSPFMWPKFVTRHMYSTWCKFQPSAVDPNPRNYDELEDCWLDLGEHYGPTFRTTALQCIDRAVENFRKNRMSPIDGMALLCRMRGFTCYIFLLLRLCLKHSGEFNEDPFHRSMAERIKEMVLSLHSIIAEYERVVLGRLAKGFDSKINEHCEKSSLQEASKELRARLNATKQDCWNLAPKHPCHLVS